MESVWWVFKTLHSKGLVYKGFKVMPYSTQCNTPLSNFEAGLDYRDVRSPASATPPARRPVPPLSGGELPLSAGPWTPPRPR